MEIKATNRKDLVVGKLYSDIKSYNIDYACILQYIGVSRDFIKFKHLKGYSAYFTNGEGIIIFSKDIAKSCFYELTEEYAEKLIKK